MGKVEACFDYLMKNGVITDWREPNVVRFAQHSILFV
jgi:kynureninase